MKLASTIADCVQEKNGVPVEIQVEEKEIALQIRLDTSLMEQDFGWCARYNLSDTVTNIYENLYGKN